MRLRRARGKKNAGPEGPAFDSRLASFFVTDRPAGRGPIRETLWAYFRFLAFLTVFFFAVLRAAGFFAAIDRFLVALRAFFAIVLSS